MAQLLVRDISKDIVTALKRQAKRNGRSAEAEHREILREALKPNDATAAHERAQLVTADKRFFRTVCAHSRYASHVRFLGDDRK
jgi:plasmid stability protein